MSANGMIVDETGNEDFLSHVNWETFSGFVKEYKNFIVGRKTYTSVKNWGESYGFDDFMYETKIVLSQNKKIDLPEGYTPADSPQKALEILKQKEFNKALVIGGASVNTAFAKAGLLDEVILNVEPVIVGKGVPLFASEDFMLQMKLAETKQITEEVIQLRYVVRK